MIDHASIAINNEKANGIVFKIKTNTNLKLKWLYEIQTYPISKKHQIQAFTLHCRFGILHFSIASI